jgi:hypothetical protein
MKMWNRKLLNNLSQKHSIGLLFYSPDLMMIKMKRMSAATVRAKES